MTTNQTHDIAPRPVPAAAVPGQGDPGRPSIGWIEVLVAVITYLALSIGLGLALYGTVTDLVAQLAVTGLIGFAAVSAAIMVRVRRPRALGLQSTSWKWLALGLAGGLAGWLVARIILISYFALTGDMSVPPEVLAAPTTAAGWQLVGLLLTGALLIPIAEELLFRGILYAALRRYGVLLAAVGSSLLFAIAHGINIVTVTAFVLGLIMVFLYERSRSIWPSVVAHAVNNALVFVMAAVLL